MPVDSEDEVHGRLLIAGLLLGWPCIAWATPVLYHHLLPGIIFPVILQGQWPLHEAAMDM